MKISNASLRSLVRSSLLESGTLGEGLRKKRDGGPRRITGSPRTIPAWVSAVDDEISNILREYDSWYGLKSLGRDFQIIPSENSSGSERWEKSPGQIQRNYNAMLDRAREIDRYRSIPRADDPFTSMRARKIKIGQLSDLTGNINHAQVDVTVEVQGKYSIVGDPRPSYDGLFSPPLEDSVIDKRDGDVYAGKITIYLGEEGIKEVSDWGRHYYVAHRRERDRQQIYSDVSHEVYHLMQYLSDRALLSPGKYGRYGSEGDRPGHESGLSWSGRKDYTEPVAIEPDAYVVSIVETARKRTLQFIEVFLRGAENKDALKDKASRGYITDVARGILEEVIESHLRRKGKEAFSGAGDSEDVKRYIKMRSLNSLDKIVSSVYPLIEDAIDRWKSEGWKRKPHTPHLNDERINKRINAARKEMIVDIVSILEEIDDIILGYLKDTVISVGSPGDFENDDAFDAAFYRDWYSKQADLLRDLQDVTVRLHTRHRAFQRLEDSIYFSSSEEDEDSFEEGEIDAEEEIFPFVQSWFDAVRLDAYNRSAEDSVTDPLIPSLGAYLDGDGKLHFSDYRKFKSNPYLRT